MTRGLLSPLSLRGRRGKMREESINKMDKKKMYKNRKITNLKIGKNFLNIFSFLPKYF
jgi:hypothetical protein